MFLLRTLRMQILQFLKDFESWFSRKYCCNNFVSEGTFRKWFPVFLFGAGAPKPPFLWGGHRCKEREENEEKQSNTEEKKKNKAKSRNQEAKMGKPKLIFLLQTNLHQPHQELPNTQQFMYKNGEVSLDALTWSTVNLWIPSMRVLESCCRRFNTISAKFCENLGHQWNGKKKPLENRMKMKVPFFTNLWQSNERPLLDQSATIFPIFSKSSPIVRQSVLSSIMSMAMGFYKKKGEEQNQTKNNIHRREIAWSSFGEVRGVQGGI